MSKRYFVTSAVPGAGIDEGFYAAIKNYCAKLKAELLILPTIPVNKSDSMDPRIPQGALVFGDKKLNDNIHISGLPIAPQAVDPVTGLNRYGQTEGSFIFASPKQRLKLVPNSNVKLPHALMTPGAITGTTAYRQNRQGMFAEKDHVVGGLIVEIASKEEYHYRQVQADADGSFIDLGKQYLPNGKVKDVYAEAIIMGDWHTGSTCPHSRKFLLSDVKFLKPKNIVLHDVLDFFSRNHHHEKNATLQANKAETGDIRLEIIECGRDIEDISKTYGNSDVFIIKSNHDEALDRYLNEKRYMHDERNFKYALELATAMIEGKDPFEYAIRKIKPNLKKVKFLERDEDLHLSAKRVQCGAHGDLGGNGAKGSLTAIELAYANSVSGHSHTPQILRNAWAVGTSTHLKLSYNKGASSWMNTHCILYPNGSRQLINIIDGKWRI